MIPVRRGPAPRTWAATATGELARVQSALLAGEQLTDQLLGIRYREVRRELRRAQRDKCCYCERKLEAKHEPVEHFRPKLRAMRSNRTRGPGYWWLTWSWQNLLFCCWNCNNNKLDKFPLEGDAVGPHFGHPLRAGHRPPGRERAILIDPAQENAAASLQFLPVMLRRKRQWRPFARAGSLRGDQTIKILGLDRDELIDLYTSWACIIERDLEPLRAAILRGDRPRVREEWNALTRRYYREDQPFTQLSLDVLDHHVPAAERRAWKLAMPKQPWRR